MWSQAFPLWQETSVIERAEWPLVHCCSDNIRYKRDGFHSYERPRCYAQVQGGGSCTSLHDVQDKPQCNAPTGGVWPDVGEGVRLLGKSTGSYGKPETTRMSLVRMWTSKLGRCLTRQSKRSCSEVMMEKAISDKPLTGLHTRVPQWNNKVEMNE